MRTRTLGAVLLAASVGLLPTLATPARADDDPYASSGRFLTPFREDGAAYDAASNTFNPDPTKPDSRGDTGCKDVPDSTKKDCLPAGATENVLADGRILYWNALEGAENLNQPTQAVIPSGGDIAKNDSSRVLTIDWPNLKGGSWETPANATGYFANDPSGKPVPTEAPLIPGTTNENGADSDGSLFCSDQKQLADGRILAAGGTNYYAEPRVDPTTGVIELEGVRNVRIFDPAPDQAGNKGNWAPTAPMNHGRWYPSMVTLADGNVFVASGVTKLVKPLYPDHAADSGDNVEQTETYNPTAQTWTDNGSTADRALPLFPRLHLLPDGHVYYDAAGQSFNPFGQSYKEALWNMAASYDPDTKAWTDLGVPGLTTATGTDDQGNPIYAEPGFRGSTFSQALPYVPENNYSSATFLTAGGVQLMSPGSYIPTTTSRLDTVAIAGGKETLTARPAGPLNTRRWFSTGVTLPTGQVLAFSGADVDEVVSPGHESPIRQAELFTPTMDAQGNYTGGKWENVAKAQRRRTYHNNAVLLPDGRVLVGGHAPIPNTYYNAMDDPAGVPGRETSSNFHDASFEIYEPPYLHWGATRPVIDKMDPTVMYDQNLQVTTRDADQITKVVLVRNPSQTHVVDADQRVVELSKPVSNGAAVTVHVPGNAAVLPPGPYMLFIIKHVEGKGDVPSIASQVFVGSAPSVTVPGWAQHVTTYPTVYNDGTNVASFEPTTTTTSVAPATGSGTGSGSASGAAPSSAAVRPASGTEVAARTVASDRAADRPRPAGLLAVALGVLFLVGSAVRGTKRRRPARITE